MDNKSSKVLQHYADSIVSLTASTSHVVGVLFFCFLTIFGKTMKKHGLPDSVLGELANDWFTDEDGTPDKTFRYFMDL